MHVRRIKVGGGKYIGVQVDLAPIVADDIHGYTKKNLIVLHETVSPDYQGIKDIVGVSNYLDSHGLGVHGVVDGEGNLGWAYGERRAILYHASSVGSKGSGQVNTRSIGIELISRVMLDYPDDASRWDWWMNRSKQIDKLARLLAFLCHAEDIPVRYSDARLPGITTHWDVSYTYGVSGGHVDCHPRHKGGYFPIFRIVRKTKEYYTKWYGGL